MDSELKIFVLTLVSTALLCFLLKMLMPEGKTGKAVAFVFSLITAFSVMQPIINLLKKGDTEQIFYDFSYETENVSVENEEMRFAEKYYFLMIKRELNDEKININKARIELSRQNDKYVITGIKINKEDLGYSGTDANIDITSVTQNVISRLFQTPKELVVVYG